MTAAAVLWVGLPVAGISLPVDCLPDAVPIWQAAPSDAGLRFGADRLPGIVLGPPGPSSPSTGSTTVASLGGGGTVTVTFADIVIEDRPGPDFIVFENAFFLGAPPVEETADYFIFAEPAVVEVSDDGVTWVAFPHDAAALAATVGSLVSRDLFADLGGLAGVTPTFTGNWILPDDRTIWDSSGTGGVSGAGGDAFDLAQVGLSQARYVRLTDARSFNGAAGTGEGFDLDALVVLNGRPLVPVGVDSDGDHLTDAAELSLYMTNPALSDSDGDGVDDGRELAGCRDPGSSATTPFVGPEPQLVVLDELCTQLRWTYPGAGRTADILRGSVAAASPLPAVVDLGSMDCLAAAQVNSAWSCDAGTPAEGQVFFYLVQLDGDDAGRSSGLVPRNTSGVCP
jgi:hypothetical protein